MSLERRLPLLALLTAGCASQVLVVPEADWQTVPPARRSWVDRQHEAELAAARAELAAATASLAELARAPATPAERPAASAGSADPDDDWAAARRDHERTRGDAFERVETAQAQWRRAELAWRELRIETAKARLEMVMCERELVRAQTIDRNLLGSDHYDTAPLRGQFSRAQQRWYAIDAGRSRTRIAVQRASTTLASSKEAYAQLMRHGPALLPVPPPPDAEDRWRRLDLSGWAITRGDISRRRGLRHFVEAITNAPPQLRRSTLKLSPPPRWAPPPAPAPATPRGANAPARAAPSDRAMPWDLIEPPARTLAGSRTGRA